MRKNFRKPNHKKILKEWFGVVVLLIVSLSFLVEGIQDCVALKKWDDTGVLEYSGSYTLSVKKPYRNTRYKFSLNNGDVLYIPSEFLINNNFDEFNDLAFKYTTHKDIFSLGAHCCVSITSIDEENIFVNEDYVKKDFQFGIVIYFLLGILSLFIASIPFLRLDIVTNIIRMSKKIKRKSRRSEGGSMIDK